VNAIPQGTRACLFNSFNFDVHRLERFAAGARGCRMVHRVGAVTSLYRGWDDGTDAHVAEINGRLAEATIAISQSTIDMYRSIGIELVNPCVVHNAIDERIFNPHGRIPWSRDRPMRVVSVSWSENPNKGGPVFRRLASVLDPDRYELTFVGNSSTPLEHARHVPPLPSRELADLLRTQDVFFTATRHDAYSNALVEALSCGLPAVYLESGGSSEAAGEGGLGFIDEEEIPQLLERIGNEYEAIQSRISLPSLSQVTDGYLSALGLDEFVAAESR
jgi:glycosyltransferase involved in cell wall biosynthesis